ncbi:MAG: tryptophan 7-halogenase, partial [Pseudomonadota bacterium]
GIGLDEPVLFTRSATAFSFGTHYLDWPGATKDWVQCHHQILPVLEGVPLQHHLTRNQRSLAPLLISGMAAQQGRFAHPPEDKANPLSRAEYGYQFCAREWRNLLDASVTASRIFRYRSQIERVEMGEPGITDLVLTSGESVTGDLFVDCTGVARKLTAAVGVPFNAKRTIAVHQSSQPSDQLGPACRRVQATPQGWTSQTFLQNAVHTLSVQAPSDAFDALSVELGGLESAWQDNAVSIGGAASVHDPLTPGPMVALQRDIERLLDLVPVSEAFGMEQREFNRRYKDDSEHTAMFASAFYATDTHDTAFWNDAKSSAQSSGLARKLTQFSSRGVLAKYDLEPFNDEDWTILHHGLGQHAARYDLQAESAPKAEIDRQLDGMSRAIEQLVTRMPPHHLYVANMKRYFEKQKYA